MPLREEPVKWRFYGDRRALRIWEDEIRGRTIQGWPTRDAACPEEEC